MFVVFIVMFLLIMFVIDLLRRMTYSPVYAKNKVGWPNMSRPRLRNYDEPCGDLRVSGSSVTTTESSLAHDAQSHYGVFCFSNTLLT